MVHQITKNKNAHPSQKHQPETRPAEAVKEVQEKLHEMARENVENITHAAREYGHAATDGLKKESEKISAFLASGGRASAIYKDMGSEIAESYNRMFSESVALSKEILACRTSKDMIELQSKAAGQLCENYFDMMNKLCGMLFDSYAEALMPSGERKSAASEKRRKAYAA